MLKQSFCWLALCLSLALKASVAIEPLDIAIWPLYEAEEQHKDEEKLCSRHHSDQRSHATLHGKINDLHCFSQVQELRRRHKDQYLIEIYDFDKTFVNKRKRKANGEKIYTLTQPNLDLVIQKFIESDHGEVHFLTSRKKSQANIDDMMVVFEQFKISIPLEHIHFSIDSENSENKIPQWKSFKILEILASVKDKRKSLQNCALTFIDDNHHTMWEVLRVGRLGDLPQANIHLLVYLVNVNRAERSPRRCTGALCQ